MDRRLIAAVGILTFGVVSVAWVRMPDLVPYASLLLPLLGLGAIGGLYRFIRSGSICANPVRKQMLAAILARPGLATQELERMVGVRRQTVTYHLNVLQEFDLVELVRDGPAVRAFPSHSMARSDRTVQLMMARPWARLVLEELRQTPSLSVRQLAKRLGVSSTTARWYLGKLRSAGLVAAPEPPGPILMPSEVGIRLAMVT